MQRLVSRGFILAKSVFTEIKELHDSAESLEHTTTLLRAEISERVTYAIVKSLGLKKPWTDESTGYLHAFVTAARIGVQPYPNHPRLGTHASYRDASFIKILAKRLEDKPLVMGHHDIRPGQNQEHEVGWIKETFVENGLVICHVVIKDLDLITKLDNSDEALGLSVGYDTEMQKVEGIWVDKNGLAGIPGQSYKYTYQQLDPMPNHLAVVPLGRGGPVLRFADNADIEDKFPVSCETPIPLVEDHGTTYPQEWVHTQDSGSEINPYPDSHVNAKYRRDSMEKDNAMYDALDSRMGKMEDALSKLTDMMGQMNDMPTMMDAMRDKNQAMCDAIGNISGFISELKKAYNDQDRPMDLEASAQEEMKAGIHSVKFVKDAAPSADDVQAVVAETSKLYITHKDELIAMGVEGFDLSPDQIKAKVLEHNNVPVKAYDSVGAQEIALRAAYDSFMVTRGAAQATQAKRSKLADAFQSFVGADAIRPAPEELKVGRHKLDDSSSYERHTDGSITYDM